MFHISIPCSTGSYIYPFWSTVRYAYPFYILNSSIYILVLPAQLFRISTCNFFMNGHKYVIFSAQKSHLSEMCLYFLFHSSICIYISFLLNNSAVYIKILPAQQFHLSILSHQQINIYIRPKHDPIYLSILIPKSVFPAVKAPYIYLYPFLLHIYVLPAQQLNK